MSSSTPRMLTVAINSIANRGVNDEVAAMFDVGAEIFALPLSEKMKYEQGYDGNSFGYADLRLHVVN